MHKQRFLALGGLLVLLLGSCASRNNTSRQVIARRPNIIVILADDMGYSDLSCMGSEISTPNLDRLASEGVLFTQFYNTARCCPTRAALLTGLYSHQADVGHMTGNGVNVQGYHNELSHDAVTIAEVMHGAGYVTYMTGKWHVTSKEKPGSPRCTPHSTLPRALMASSVGLGASCWECAPVMPSASTPAVISPY